MTAGAEAGHPAAGDSTPDEPRPELDESRPALTAELTGAELQRWYWLKEELAAFARQLGVRATGSKGVLTARLAAHLDGEDFVEVTPGKPKRASAQLSAPLTPATRIPPGQRCSQVLRAWFEQEIGPHFRFDAAMREFIAGADGTQTLADAVEHWKATRVAGSNNIGEQFEYNRFTRAWYESHPKGSREGLRQAWQEYRRQPVDARGRA